VPRHPRATLSQLLAASVRGHPQAVALVTSGKPALTYGGLGAKIDAIAAGLAAAGFGRDSRIGIALHDETDFAIVLLAVCSTATCAPLNAALDEDALVRLLVAMRIDALIVPEGGDSAAVRAARRASVPLIELRDGSGDPGRSPELVVASTRGGIGIDAPLAEPDRPLFDKIGQYRAQGRMPQGEVVQLAA